MQKKNRSLGFDLLAALLFIGFVLAALSCSPAIQRSGAQQALTRISQPVAYVLEGGQRMMYGIQTGQERIVYYSRVVSDLPKQSDSGELLVNDQFDKVAAHPTARKYAFITTGGCFVVDRKSCDPHAQDWVGYQHWVGVLDGETGRVSQSTVFKAAIPETLQWSQNGEFLAVGTNDSFGFFGVTIFQDKKEVLALRPDRPVVLRFSTDNNRLSRVLYTMKDMHWENNELLFVAFFGTSYKDNIERRLAFNPRTMRYRSLP